MYTGDNGTGSSLGSYPFGLGQLTINLPDGRSVTTNNNMFIFSIPYDDTARSLVLTGPKNTLTVNKSTFGNNAPSVDFTNPKDGATASGDLNITWTGSDDSGTVYYRLEYSPDGTNWTPLAHKLTATSYTVNTRLWPGGENDLAIIAYDGFNTTRKEITVKVANGVGIAGTAPAANQTGVSEGTLVLVDFVSPMDAATLSKTTFQLLEAGTTGVDGMVTYNSAVKRALFIPKNSLKSNTSYTAKLISGSAGIKDTAGNSLSSDYVWTFVTGATQSNPHILGVWPENGATDAAVNTLIQATFDKEMKGSSITTTSFTVVAGNGTAVAGTVSYDSTNKSAVFIPSANLAANTTYTATLTTAIVDASAPGNPLVSNYIWTFTTGSTQITAVRIDGIEYDMALDKNGDGFYDSLLIRVQVEVLVPGTYNLNAQLKDKDGVDITWTSVTKSFGQKGVYFVDAEFSGSDIAAHGIDGPYTVTNVYIYNTSNVNSYDALPGSYLTYPDKASQFYSVIRLLAIPNVVVAQDSENLNVINLEKYATHATVPSSSLQYRILINSNTGVGASINSGHQLDIKPTAGLKGYSDLTLEVKDSSNNRALNTLRVNVSGAYKFPQEGWYLISLPNVPPDPDIFKVLSPISGKYTSVWGYSNGQWSVFSPDQPGFSDLTTMGVDKAYWFYVKQAGSLFLLGSPIPPHPIHLAQGWNFVGFNSTVSRPVADALSSIAGRYLAVWAFVDGKWKLFDPNNPGISDLTDLEPGYGYWIYTTMATDWVM